MTANSTVTATPGPLRIEGEMTIFRAAELKPVLLSEPPLAALDLSGVTEIDSAGMQLLLMASRSAAARQGSLQLLRPSACVSELLTLFDVSAHFKLQAQEVQA